MKLYSTITTPPDIYQQGGSQVIRSEIKDGQAKHFHAGQRSEAELDEEVKRLLTRELIDIENIIKRLATCSQDQEYMLMAIIHEKMRNDIRTRTGKIIRLTEIK